MHPLTSSILFAALLLAACSAEPVVDVPMETDHTAHQAETVSNDTLGLVDRSTDAEINFHVMEESTLFTDYGVSHTKEMHLIVVRDDLRHFYHLHPSRDATGNWTVAFTPEAGGTYRFYADFVDAENNGHLLTFEREYSGDRGEYGVVQDPATTTRTVGGYEFRMDSTDLGDGGIELHYEAFDAAGKPVTFEKYLGEKGHVVLLSPDGEYIHTHPHHDYVGYTESDPPVFITGTLWEKFYRIYAQFQIDGTVITVPFDWQRTGPGPDPERRPRGDAPHRD